MKKQISPKIVSLTFGILVICFAIGFYVYAWTEPTASPPGGNVDAPLNVSNIGQTKEGGLALNTGVDGIISSDGAANGLLIYEGNVGIGTTDPSMGSDGTQLKLDVDGPIGATMYCDENGNNCKTITEMGGGLTLGDWDTTDSGQVGGTGTVFAHDVTYQAATDGFVIAEMIADHCGQGIQGYTDSNNPASTLRVRNGSGYIDQGGAGITMPVKRNDYWRVKRQRTDGYCWGTLVIYWIPIISSGGGGRTYISDWTSISTGTNVSFSHPLNTDQVIVTVQFKPTLTGTIRGQHTSDYAGHGYGIEIYEISSTQIKVSGGSANMHFLDSNGYVVIYSSGYVRVLLQAIN